MWRKVSCKLDDVCVTSCVQWVVDITIFICRRIQGQTPYMCEQFGADGKLYVEVIRTSCFMVEHRNGLHHQKALDNFLDN